MVGHNIEFALKVYVGETPDKTYVFSPSGELIRGVAFLHPSEGNELDNVVPSATIGVIIQPISEVEKDDLLGKNKKLKEVEK